MLYSIYSMMVIIQEFDTVNYLLACLVHIQRADSEYPSVDFTSATSTLSHFRELCASFGDIPQEMIDDFFGDISRLAGAQGDAAHRIMREVCGLVHNVIAQSKGRDPWETATEVITVLDNAMWIWSSWSRIISLVATTKSHCATEGSKTRSQKILPLGAVITRSLAK
ncbi:hypothetical protein BD779DRAFT_83352 [Infundibulicybe gibba]|nr:hypothetical protein BD779DRAFT_83352 [Infundibulicybe gibba]